ILGCIIRLADLLDVITRGVAWVTRDFVTAVLHRPDHHCILGWLRWRRDEEGVVLLTKELGPLPCIRKRFIARSVCRLLRINSCFIIAAIQRLWHITGK